MQCLRLESKLLAFLRWERAQWRQRRTSKLVIREGECPPLLLEGCLALSEERSPPSRWQSNHVVLAEREAFAWNRWQ